MPCALTVASTTFTAASQLTTHRRCSYLSGQSKINLIIFSHAVDPRIRSSCFRRVRHSHIFDQLGAHQRSFVFLPIFFARVVLYNFFTSSRIIFSSASASASSPSYSSSSSHLPAISSSSFYYFNPQPFLTLFSPCPYLPSSSHQLQQTPLCFPVTAAWSHCPTRRRPRKSAIVEGCHVACGEYIRLGHHQVMAPFGQCNVYQIQWRCWRYLPLVVRIVR